MNAYVYQLAEQYPGWNFLLILSTAVLSNIAPVAGLVTIGCGLLHAYIAWQKYRHWRRNSRG